MRALVTGGTGFIGSRLCARMSKEGMDVTALVRPTSDVQALPDPATAVECDGTAVGMASIIERIRPDWVFHLAANQTLDPKVDDVDDLIASNVLLGAQLAHACATVGVAAFINTGTLSQHLGGADYRPATLYAATKQALMDLLVYYSDARDLPVLNLELPGTYGPGDTRRKVLDLVIEAQEKEAVLDMSPGGQVLDLVHVDDVIEGYLAAARLLQETPSLKGSTFALHGENLRLRDVVSLLEKVSGSPLPVNLGALPYREREMMDVSPTPPLPGWQQRVSLFDGIRQMLDARPENIEESDSQ